MYNFGGRYQSEGWLVFNFKVMKTVLILVFNYAFTRHGTLKYKLKKCSPPKIKLHSNNPF